MKGGAAHDSNAHGDGDVVNQIGDRKAKGNIKKWGREAVDFKCQWQREKNKDGPPVHQKHLLPSIVIPLYHSH
jgi:hypothetical protein